MAEYPSYSSKTGEEGDLNWSVLARNIVFVLSLIFRNHYCTGFSSHIGLKPMALGILPSYPILLSAGDIRSFEATEHGQLFCWAMSWSLCRNFIMPRALKGYPQPVPQASRKQGPAGEPFTWAIQHFFLFLASFGCHLESVVKKGEVSVTLHSFQRMKIEQKTHAKKELKQTRRAPGQCLSHWLCSVLCLCVAFSFAVCTAATN